MGRRNGRPGPGAGLVRVVEREPDHLGRDPLAVPVDLADIDLGADLGVLDRHPAQHDVLPWPTTGVIVVTTCDDLEELF